MDKPLTFQQAELFNEKAVSEFVSNLGDDTGDYDLRADQLVRKHRCSFFIRDGQLGVTWPSGEGLSINDSTSYMLYTDHDGWQPAEES